MAGGGGENSWKWMLGLGGVGIAAGMGLEHSHAGPAWLVGGALALGGLSVVFGACETMIKAVEGIGDRLGWSPFVAGTMAGLASNLPEIVMIGFIVAADPRLAFIMTALTLQVGALAFGGYCLVLPKSEGGAQMPAPLIGLSTDMYACAGTILLTLGFMMVMMREFPGPRSHGFDAKDLYLIGFLLLSVQVVAVVRLVQRFSGDTEADVEEANEKALEELGEHATMSNGAIAGFGIIGTVASIIGGHAVGDFADMLVQGLKADGYSEMFGALVLSFFACAGVLVMIVSTHMKGLHDLAIANVSGAVNQVPFVVWPVVMITHAAFAQMGIVELYEHGVVLPIDLETTSVVLLGAPPMIILWKSIQDDGKVNTVEAAGMTAVFVLTLFLLGAHG